MSTLKILVAEDEAFQKLSMIDIFSLCDYEVEAVDNGRQALEALQANPDMYDLVLLDIIMPEMDGLECLEQIMKDERLKDIPVVMMSANEETEFVSASLAKGAKNYIIKPLRTATVKQLRMYMRSNNKGTASEAPMLKGLQNYTTIKELGKGATGSVSLVKCLSGENKDKLYALKQVRLSLLGVKEAKMAENEVQLLKVLVGPTIIRYYDSYSTKESISIIMEYAEGGSLSDRITKYCDIKKRFSKDQVLDWTAQIALGLMIMHIKKILHRDIKTQNMFLVKMGDEEVVKIGDFGISKELGTVSDMAKTSCGTPYFMSPEVVRGEPYNDKSDMWALGCVLYELTTFSKPFDSATVPGLYELIKTKDFASLPSDTDMVIRMLIGSLLNKDPSKRPSIWEFARIPEIKNRINAFVERHECADMVAHVMQVEVKGPKQSTTKAEKEKEKAPFHTIQLNLERIDELVMMLRTKVKLQNIKVGWFKTYENCVSGSDLVNCLLNIVGGKPKNAVEMLETLMEKGVLYNVDGSTKFENSDKTLYKFQMDREDIAANMVWPWVKEYHKPISVSVELLTEAIKIYKDLLKESDEGKLYIEYDKLAEHADYLRYVSSSAELQGVNLSALGKKEKFMFFLNIYQAMYIHFLLKYPPQKESSGIIGKFFDNSKASNFFYNIAGMIFTLDDIKHGILRGNKRAPNAMMRNFGSNDKRKMLPDNDNPRIHFLALDYPELPVQMEVFTEKSDLDERLEYITKEYINNTMCFDDYNGELVLPMILQKYSSDFAPAEDKMISWVWKYFTGSSNYTAEDIIIGINKRSIMIKYVDQQ